MELLTARELREFLKISRTTQYRLLKQGMPSHGTGRLRRFEPKTVMRWLNGGRLDDEDTTPFRSGLYRCGMCQGIFERKQPFSPDVAYCPRCYTRTLEWVGIPVPEPAKESST